MNKQTRGRPKKNQAKKLPQIYRTMFTQHDTVCYGLSLMYVMEIFAQTKSQKRIGHSEGSFTSYEKVLNSYSYDTFDQDIENWGATSIFQIESVSKFSRHLVGLAPKIVLRELITIVHQYITNTNVHKLSPQDALIQTRRKYSQMNKSHLDKEFKYLRYTTPALVQLRQTKNTEMISSKVNELWPIFIRIFTYCIYCCHQNIETNKYLKPLFSDAAKPEDTLIGQLTLKQIYEQTQWESFDEVIVQENRVSSCSFVKWNQIKEDKVKPQIKIQSQEKYEPKQGPIVRKNLILVMRPEIKLQSIMQTNSHNTNSNKQNYQIQPIKIESIIHKTQKASITKETINSQPKIENYQEPLNQNIIESLSFDDENNDDQSKSIEIRGNQQNQQHNYEEQHKRFLPSSAFLDIQCKEIHKKIKPNQDKI